MRDTLLSFGYAFAASSYSKTAFALKEGEAATLQLKRIFSARFGKPSRTYLYGHSLGAAVVLKLAEQHARAFDGALVMCGMIGGSPAELQYVIDARATFDAIFPGVAPGSVASVPPLTFYGDVAPAVLALFDPANPDFVLNVGRAAAWASSDQVAFPFATAPELVRGILEVLYYQTLGLPDVVEAAGGFPASNDGVVYSWGPSAVGALSTVEAAAVNSAVQRVSADPRAFEWATEWYDTTGAISFPVMTLHTVRDAAVPISHERLYADKAAAAGRSHLLVQRTVSHDPRAEPPDGHCSFKPAEELAALADLLEWVATGTRPAGGDATVGGSTPIPVTLPPGSGLRPRRCLDAEDEGSMKEKNEREERCERRTRHLHPRASTDE